MSVEQGNDQTSNFCPTCGWALDGSTTAKKWGPLRSTSSWTNGARLWRMSMSKATSQGLRAILTEKLSIDPWIVDEAIVEIDRLLLADANDLIVQLEAAARADERRKIQRMAEHLASPSEILNELPQLPLEDREVLLTRWGIACMRIGFEKSKP